MPIEIRELQIRANVNGQSALQLLEARVALLERALQVTNEKVTLSCGASVITLAATGNVTITGRDVTMTSSSKMSFKSSGEIALKGAKISEN